MNKKGITAYSIIISLIFVLAVSFFCTNIYFEYTHGFSRTEKEFRNLCTMILENKFDFKENAKMHDNYNSLIIYKNSQLAFVYPQDRVLHQEDTNLIKVYKRNITVKSEVFQINAAMYILRPAVIFYYAAIAFIIIFIATITTIVLIIVLSAKDNHAMAEIKNEHESLQIVKEINNNNSENIEPQKEVEDLEPAVPGNEEVDLQQNEINKPSNEQESKVTFDYRIKEENDDTPLQENIKHLKASNTDTGSKSGFYTEDGLISRIETELGKAASKEEDLSLLLIKIQNLEFGSEKSNAIADILISEFQFKDAIFEFGYDGFAVIKNDTSIDDAEIIADTIHAKITGIQNITKDSCFIGISSRTTRLLAADRLLLEAKEALRHSITDGDSPITGFHVDVEKYREFLRNS